MNQRKPGSTKPTREEVAQFEALTLHELGRLLAAAREAYRRKVGRSRSKTA